MKKILLLFPNLTNWAAIRTEIPVLAGIARQRGWEMAYFDTYQYQKRQDSDTDKEDAGIFKSTASGRAITVLQIQRLLPDLQNKLDHFKPDILAVNGMSPDFEFLKTFFYDLIIPKETLVIMGGVHATFQPDEVINTGLFDVVCIGEGEGTFTEILAKVEGSKSIADIEGTYHRDRRTGGVVHNKMRRMLDAAELWQSPEDYSFYHEQYFLRPFDGRLINRLDVEAGRGCPYDCNYCVNSKYKKLYRGLGSCFKQRPIESCFRLLRRMVDEHNIQLFSFVDECFLSYPKAWLKQFAERYAAEIRTPFLIQTRPETVSEETIGILKSFKAPQFEVRVGVEAGSEKILNEVCNRRCSVESSIRAFDLLHKHGVRNCAFFMVGLPYETREDIFKSIELCRRLNPTVTSVAIYQPLPGQSLTDKCLQQGFLTGREPKLMFTKGSVLKMPQISSEEILNLWKTFTLYAYLPEQYHRDIEKCERDFASHKRLFTDLIRLRWKYEKIKACPPSS